MGQPCAQPTAIGQCAQQLLVGAHLIRSKSCRRKGSCPCSQAPLILQCRSTGLGQVLSCWKLGSVHC